MSLSTTYGLAQANAARALIGGDVIADTRNELLKQLVVAVANKTGGGGGGTGDVVGPASSTDGAVALWDGLTGKLLKDSTAFITGSGTVALGGFTLTVPATGTAALLEVSNIFTVNGAASTPAMSLTGTPFTGGTSTTTKPLFLIEPAGTTSTGWGTDGTMLGVNAPSGLADTGHLISLQRNGSRMFAVAGNGAVEFGGNSMKFDATVAIATYGGTRLFLDALDLSLFVNLALQEGLNITSGTTTGSKIAASASQKLGFWGVTPVVQQVLATGASHTVDEVIGFLQTIGLCKQS